MKVWLDDVRPMPPGFDVHARTAAEAIALPRAGRLGRISLDHDLGEGENGTGYEVARRIEEHAFRWAQGDPDGLPPLEWDVHSMNVVGVQNMILAMRNAERFWQERPGD